MNLSDPLTLLALASGGLVLLLGASAWMLHRSWGSFPTQPDYRLLNQPTRPPVPEPFSPELATPDALPTPSQETPPPASPDRLTTDDGGEYLLIHSPLLIQVIHRARSQNNALAQHVVEDGEQLYLALHTIRNPRDRQRIAELIAAFQSDNHVGVWDMIDLMAQLGRGVRLAAHPAREE